MKRKFVILIFLAAFIIGPAIFVLLLVNACGNQDRSTPSVSHRSVDGWEITLSTDRKSYSEFDTIVASLDIKNMTDQERSLPDTEIDILLGFGKLEKGGTWFGRDGDWQLFPIDLGPDDDRNTINFSEDWNWAHNHTFETGVVLKPNEEREIARLTWGQDTSVFRTGQAGTSNMAIGRFGPHTLVAEFTVRVAGR